MRERRAEKLRREYERVGREQDGIFESLADYTHEVQAEVHALEAARDLLLAAGGTAVAVADEDDDHASDSAGGDVCRQEALGAETFSGVSDTVCLEVFGGSNLRYCCFDV